MIKMLIFISFSVICMNILVSYGFGKNSSDNQENSPIYTGAPQKAVYRKISAEQAKAIMEEGKPYVLLDVRTEKEFKEKRIAGAVLIPDSEIGKRAAAMLPDKDILILVYCRSGNRSANAARRLINMGYTNVFDLGGIGGWPYGTVRE